MGLILWVLSACQIIRPTTPPPTSTPQTLLMADTRSANIERPFASNLVVGFAGSAVQAETEIVYFIRLNL